MFANHGKEDGIYPLTTIEIVTAQKKYHQFYSKNVQKHQKWIWVFNLLKSLGISTPRNPHYQAMAISLVWPTPLSNPVTEYLASQEYNRDISLATTIQK
jgi:hypothetical protein